MICLQTLKHLNELLIQKFFNWNILKVLKQMWLLWKRKSSFMVAICLYTNHVGFTGSDPKIQNIIVLCTFVNKNVRKPNKKDLHIPLINKSKKERPWITFLIISFIFLWTKSLMLPFSPNWYKKHSKTK